MAFSACPPVHFQKGFEIPKRILYNFFYSPFPNFFIFYIFLRNGAWLVFLVGTS
jgi:hypothetical protein